jgi:hypothetical protein
MPVKVGILFSVPSMSSASKEAMEAAEMLAKGDTEESDYYWSDR